MTVTRVVALAQALAMIMLLAPAPTSLPPVSAQSRSAAAAQPARVVNTLGGIGCVVKSGVFKGVKVPSDPPWPPDAEPTAAPSGLPAVDPLASPGPVAQAGAAAGQAGFDLAAFDLAAGAPALPGIDTAAIAGTALVSGAIRTSQAAPSASPSGAPGDLWEADLSGDPGSAGTAGAEPVTLGSLVRGIDVSHHNGDVDYAKVRKAGRDFVFIKVTQDNDFVDPMFVTNLARARAAGLVAGGYHFFDYTMDGTVQADHFLDLLEAAGGLDGAMPPVVDVECWKPIGASIHAVSAARLRDFVERVYERTGRLPILYTSTFMWRQVMGNAEGFEALPMWAACWSCSMPPSIAPGWQGWTFWQTGTDAIKGVGTVGDNVFSGSTEQLEALRLRPLSVVGGATVTGKQQVVLDLGGRDATHLRTSLDGETWSDWQPVSGRMRAELAAEDGPQELHVQLRVGPRLRSPVYMHGITLDRVGPEVDDVLVGLALGALGTAASGWATSSVPVEVTWRATDAAAGVADASLSVACGEADATVAEIPGTGLDPGTGADVATTWSGTTAVAPSARCSAAVVALDSVGNEGRSDVGTFVTESVKVAGTEPPAATVQGDQVGVIARRGPDQGIAAVLLDGEVVGTVDLYAPEAGVPEVVFVADLAPDAISTISLAPTGTQNVAATGSGLAFEGVVTLSRD